MTKLNLRGFSHKELITAENISSLFIVLNRIIKDHMFTNNSLPQHIDISAAIILPLEELVQNVLDDKKKESQKEKANKQYEMLQSEKTELITRNERLLNVCKKLDT